jgi:hypothetical protein
VYKCYIATSPVNKGESEDRNCYINCYKLQRQVLHAALARNGKWQMANKRAQKD